MTLDEHIAECQRMSEDGHGQLQVAFGYNYGDYWKTQVAPFLEEEACVAVVAQNDRLDMPEVIDVDKVLEVEQDHRAEGISTDYAEDGTSEMKYEGKILQQVVLFG